MKLPRFLFWLYQLSPADQAAVVGPYSVLPGRPRAFLQKRSHNLIFALVSILAIFLILPIMPFHWLAIPTTIGSGLSFALILSWFWRPLPEDAYSLAEPPRSGLLKPQRSHRYVVVVDRTGAARIMRRKS